ncbi:MAG: hypothetical protein WED12_05465 [Chloroflexota bacterium]
MKIYSPAATDFGGAAGTLVPGLTGGGAARIGLLWNGKPNGDVVLDTVGRELAGHRPGWVADEIVKGWMPTELALLEELAASVDAVVGAPAD